MTLYTSTGGAPLQKRAAVDNVSSMSPSDMHFGILRLPKGGKQPPGASSVYYSNMWIETGPPSGL